MTNKTKFNVDKGKQARTFDGKCFDSILEMKYYRDVVCPMLESGEIKKCDLQVSFELQPKYKHDGENIHAITYVADFVITYQDGTVEVIDTKGLPDSVSKIKKKLFHYKYPGVKYTWISYSKQDGGWVEYKKLSLARSKRKREKKKVDKNG